MATVVVTGCNRGIGLELVRQYHARGDDVLGTCRTSNSALDQSGISVVDGVDVAEEAGVERLASALDNRRLDILIHNAGILTRDDFESVDYDDMLEQFRVNSIGPLRIVRALRKNLTGGSKIGIVSSRVGSIEDNSSGQYYSYRCSKVAANMVGRNLHHELAPHGIAVALLHPGYVATDMTSGQGNTTPPVSAAGLIARMDELGLETSGRFWHAEGYEIPW